MEYAMEKTVAVIEDGYWHCLFCNMDLKHAFMMLEHLHDVHGLNEDDILIEKDTMALNPQNEPTAGHPIVSIAQ